MEKINRSNGALSLSTPLQVEKHPHFMQMLNNLFENKLDTDFGTKSLLEEKKVISKDYFKAQKEYNASKLVYNCVWEVIVDSNVDSKILEKLKHALISSELNESMKIIKPNLDPHGEQSVLEVFGTEIKKQLFDEELQNWLHDQIKNKLIEKGTELLIQLGQDTEGNNQLLMAKLNKLPSLITSQLEARLSARKSNQENDQAFKEQYSKYAATMLESLQIMESLVEKHMIEIQMDQYAANSHSLKVQCDALLLKIKSLHLEILCETYTKDTVPALKKILQDLENRAEQTENEIQASRARLSRYESVGQDFNIIVNEYGQLREAIKQKTWTLEKLSSYCPPK